MSTAGLPTIWELVADAARALPEPFSRAQLINWVRARRPDVGVASISSHIQFATDNAAHTASGPFAGRAPLLHRVGRGLYARYRPEVVEHPAPQGTSRVVLIASSGATAKQPHPAATLFVSPGFEVARDHAVRSGHPWFVLSAKHGLLDPGDVVGPFDVQISDQASGYRATWGEWVVAQLASRVQLQDAVVEVHGGVDFAQPLRAPLTRRGAQLDIPLPGVWRESEPGWTPGTGWTPPPLDHAPVRHALDRLRELVSGRPRQAPDDSAPPHASAS
jgi:hypothetical protein